MRRRKRKDANHGAVVLALSEIGAVVVDLSDVGGGVPDLLVGYRLRTVLLEVKSVDARGRMSDGARRSAVGQERWRAEWRGGPVFVVTSPDEAISAVTTLQIAPGSPISPAREF